MDVTPEDYTLVYLGWGLSIYILEKKNSSEDDKLGHLAVGNLPRGNLSTTCLGKSLLVRSS